MKSIFVLRAVKVISLLLAVVMAVSVLQKGPLHHWDGDIQRLSGFRVEKENSLDVVFLGASDLYTGFSAPYAYERYGFTSYPFTVSGCPVTFWRVLLAETLSRQSPQLVVVEVTGATYLKSKELHDNGALHHALDDMPLSFEKLRAVTALCSENTDSGWTYLFPLLKYHLLWNDVKRQDSNRLNRSALLDRGYAMLRGVTSKAVALLPEDGIRDVMDDYSEGDLAEEAEQALLDFLDYCRAKKLNILFTRFPHRLGTSDNEIYEEFQRVNRVGRIITEQGFPFLNLDRMVDDIGLDQNQDYYDRTHFNLYGQLKVTEFFSRYLVQEYGITPRPQPVEVQNGWNTSAEYYRIYCEYVKQQAEKGYDGLIGESAYLIAELDGMRAQPVNPDKEG